MPTFQSQQVVINALRLYAYHGVMPQEQKVGAYFIIDIEVETDFSQAMKDDNLNGTISYADIFSIIKKEMSIPSKLIEHVAGRITDRIFLEIPASSSVHLKIIKENPPMGADCRGAGVDVRIKR